MLKQGRLLGGILLVSGTAIGAGMLAIPVTSSFAGFIPSICFLVACWFFLFITSWLLLDVNLACPGDVNLITMAHRHLGFWGKAICWVTYLLLLYSLTAAYIAGSAPLFLQAMEWMIGSPVPSWVGPLPLLFLFGLFVYLGTSSVDKVNRVLMIGLILSYFFLVVFLPPHIQPTFLRHRDFHAVWMAVPIMITSFGFHIIIPTLTTYLGHDRKKLRLTIFLGSLLPLIVYIIWEFLVLGIVPLTGDNGLIQAWVKGETGVAPLQEIIQNRWIYAAASTFSFFAIITSFLGVSLSLSDFLSDGLKMKHLSLGKELVCLLTFAPPLLFVYFYPRGFLLALQYAGVFVAILLCIFPALMAWKLPRYRSHLHKTFLAVIILISLFIMGLNLLEEAEILKKVIDSYVQT
jgi:tyrosine-specific transport protein